MPRLLTLLGLLAAAAAGLLAGAAGSFVQAVAVWRVPVGLVGALALSVGVVVAAGVLLRRRSGAVAATAGWVVAVLLMGVPRPEGDQVLDASWRTQVWLLAGVVLLGAVAAQDFGRLTRRPRAAPSATGQTDHENRARDRGDR